MELHGGDEMSKYDTYRAARPSLRELHPDLAPALDQLTIDQDRHFEIVKLLLGPNGPGVLAPLFPVDIVFMSVLNRSLDLIAGFVGAFESWNLSTAAPTVRMQVDNLLRLCILAKSPPEAVDEMFLSGKPLNKVVDPLAPPGSKVKLTDHTLREHARPHFPWVDEVYTRSSGWVHLSQVHIEVAMHVDDDGFLSARFPSDIDNYPHDFLEQVLWAMGEATSAVLQIIEDFAVSKADSLRTG